MPTYQSCSQDVSEYTDVGLKETFVLSSTLIGVRVHILDLGKYYIIC